MVLTVRAGAPRALLDALHARADGYLLKPPRPTDLATTLARVSAKGTTETASGTGHGFRAIFEGAAFGALILDAAADRILTVNRTSERLLGSLEGELNGQPMSGFIHPEDRPEFRRLYGLLASGRAGSLSFRGRGIDCAGDPLGARLTLSAIPSERGGIGHIAVLLDAPRPGYHTGPARRELDAVWNATHDALIRVDQEGFITAWSRAAERIYGYAAEEAIGQPSALLSAPEHRDEMEDALGRLRKGHRIGPWQTVHRTRDRQPRYLSLTGCPIRDAGAQPCAALFAARDRSREHNLEQRLLEASAREQQRIGQDLHDGLGQELTGIAFLARSLRNELAEAGSPQAENAEQIVGYINEAITHAKALVKGLRPRTLEGRGLVQALRELVEATCRTHRIDCHLEADDDVQIHDPETAVHLYYIAKEALNNAVHHGQAGCVQLHLETADGNLRLLVRDDGIGLSSGGPKNAGSGLDIMNCRAQMIGGSLQIRGTAERGTEVACSVDLPAGSASTTSQ